MCGLGANSVRFHTGQIDHEILIERDQRRQAPVVPPFGRVSDDQLTVRGMARHQHVEARPLQLDGDLQPQRILGDLRINQSQHPTHGG